MAIPYATWANRGRGQMTVWLARTDAAARPTPYPTVATTSTVTASPPGGRGKNARPITDGEEPPNSASRVVLRLVARTGWNLRASNRMRRDNGANAARVSGSR